MRVVKDEGIIKQPKVLIFGGPGVGKTTLVARMAPKPCLHLDFDYGGSSYLTRTAGADGAPLVPADGLTRVVEITSANVETIVGQARAGKLGDYRSVVVDSLTYLQTLHRETIVGARLTATRQEWGENVEWCRRVLVGLAGAQYALIATALDEPEVTEQGVLTSPAVSPALLRSIEGLFDVIAHLSVRQTEQGPRRWLQISPAPGIRCKDRTGLLPDHVLDPGFGLIDALVPAVKEVPTETTTA